VESIFAWSPLASESTEIEAVAHPRNNTGPKSRTGPIPPFASRKAEVHHKKRAPVVVRNRGQIVAIHACVPRSAGEGSALETRTRWPRLAGGEAFRPDGWAFRSDRSASAARTLRSRRRPRHPISGNEVVGSGSASGVESLCLAVAREAVPQLDVPPPRLPAATRVCRRPARCRAPCRGTTEARDRPPVQGSRQSLASWRRAVCSGRSGWSCAYPRQAATGTRKNSTRAPVAPAASVGVAKRASDPRLTIQRLPGN
jgi:hypothetical protein